MARGLAAILPRDHFLGGGCCLEKAFNRRILSREERDDVPAGLSEP
jgi:hypothetical protein